MSLHRLARYSFWSGLIVISWLVFMPQDELPPIQIWDKLAHALAFAALMLAGSIAYRHRLSMHVIALLLGLYGVGIEIIQHPLPDRYFSLLDMLANVVGILVAWPLVMPIERIFRIQTP